MEHFIRKIVKEELDKVLLEIKGPTIDLPREDHMLLNFDTGRSFGINKLSNDIEGLSQYYMSSYFPNSGMKENWIFELEKNYGGFQIIEIIHALNDDYNNYWKINIAEVEPNSNEPQIIASSGKIESYSEFVDLVNSKYKKIINPGFL